MTSGLRACPLPGLTDVVAEDFTRGHIELSAAMLADRALKSTGGDLARALEIVVSASWVHLQAGDALSVQICALAILELHRKGVH